jgi:tRNA dimethylallyltransferase
MDYKIQLDNFINRESKLKKLIVIYWPTWSWKTDMSINIAKILNTEIISTDSRQIFKYMDIWTWKITNGEMKWVIHHMLDIITPDQKYSTWEFKKTSEEIIENLYKKNKIPMLVWWTGLYIDSLIYDFNIPEVPADEKLRENLEKQAKEKWKNYIFDKLKKLDSDYDRNLHKNNLRYVIRALEVKMLTWKSKTSFKRKKELKYDVLFLTPEIWTREKLYNRINKRVEMMFDMWLVEEIKWLLKMWYKKTDFGLASIWYQEVIPYIIWDISKKEAITKVQQNSRNYAKRQFTWFNKYKMYL